MRHGKKRLQLNRFTSWRKATLKSLARNLLIQQSIRTSLHKAKAVKPLVEKIITLAKANTLAAKRQAYDLLGDHKLVSVVFGELGARFASRTGGYTRIINLGSRRGDNARLAILELVEIKKKEVKKLKKETKEEVPKAQAAKEKPIEEARPRTETAVKLEEHPERKKQKKRFFSGIKKIFKKERDSL